MSNMETKIAVALPTRGFIFADTLISLKRNGLTDIHIVPGLPIPDCHNEATKQALTSNPTHVLLFEEDMVIPDGTIEKMLDINGLITVVDYSLGSWKCTHKNKAGEIMFGGTGCMLIRKEVFDRMPYPWFENDKTFDIKTWDKLDVKCDYGGQDIYFCYKARKMGIQIQEVPDLHATHLRCKNLERVQTNSGCYQFFELDYENSKPIKSYI